MRSFLLALFLLPLTIFSQDGWVKVSVQTDDYGGETSWEIYQESEIVAVSPPYVSNSLQEVVIPLDSGDYNFVIYDSFGDGICCDFGNGWYSLTNSCGLEIYDYEFAGPSTTTFFEVPYCEPPITGCMDVGALNFNPWANDQAPCVFPPMPCGPGQTNIIALITPDSYPSETSWDITANGEVVASGEGYTTTGVTSPTYVCVGVGDTLVASIYDSYGDGLCGTCWGGVDGYFDVRTLCGEDILFIGGVELFDTASSGPYIVPPCVPITPQGCTDSNYIEYNPEALIDDNSCLTEVVLGCTQEEALNYNPTANTIETEASCDYSLVITDGGADGWFGSWLGLKQGGNLYGPYQMGPNDGYEEEFNLTLNSNEDISVYFFTGGNAETTAAQCGFRVEGPNGVVLESGTNPWTDPLKKFPYIYNGTPVCSDYCVLPVVGCTDDLACNYNNEANVDEGCFFSVQYYDCDNACNNDMDNDGVCDELEVVGCMNPTAFNYNVLATDAGDCEPFIFGCTDPTQYNYDPEANTENGGCIPYIYGCTDSDAFNYDPLANSDNGSCIEVLEGCADPEAYNYDTAVNMPDPEVCLYEAVGCVTGLGEPYGDGYWLNDMCFAWVIQADPYCCEEEWDNTCQETFNYCSATGIETILTGDDLVVYPNPVGDVLNINKNIDINVFDSMGRVVVSKVNTNILETSIWAPGMYTVCIAYSNRFVTKRIIKQ